MLKDGMKKENYESPRFDFEEMQLTEKVADTCWGYAYAWYDADKDGKIDVQDGEKVELSDLGLGASGCQGEAARKALMAYFNDKFGLGLTEDDVSTNTKSPLVIGNRIRKSPKYLTIGDFSIAFQKESTNIKMDIPFSGMAFYHPEERACDFHFFIAAQETDKHRELLWGSEEFAIPTFLYQRHDGQFDWITKQKDRSPGLSFRISRDWNQFVLYEDHTKTNGERAFHEFGSLFSYAVLNHHACVLHGVVMEYNGMGILVLASAGTGKTTHTRMWRDHKNALILNGDRCLCRKKDGVWYAYGMPWSGSSGE